MCKGVRLSHGYSNETLREDETVKKRYLGPERHATARREADVLRTLHGLVPVPRVLGFDAHDATLRLEWVEGVNGQALLDDTRATVVLEQCGLLLRAIQQLPPEGLTLSGEGQVVVHGDFGPHNILFGTEPIAGRATVDWEWARLGTPVEDLAWAEWIVRMHDPDQVRALPALFDGYGSEPAWAERHAAMLENCERVRERAIAGGNQATIASWDERIQWTRAFG